MPILTRYGRVHTDKVFVGCNIYLNSPLENDQRRTKITQNFDFIFTHTQVSMFLHTVSFDRNRSFYDNSKVFFLSPHYRGDDYREKHRVPFLYRRRPLVCVVVMCMHAFIFAGIGAIFFACINHRCFNS